MAKNSVIPTGAERNEAQRRDLFSCPDDKTRSLGYAARWASLGMTECFQCDGPGPVELSVVTGLAAFTDRWGRALRPRRG